MDIKSDNLKKEIRRMMTLGHIAPENLPDIDLYMDQLTTFMDQYLSGNKRNEDEKTLTKTMINNYTKNELLPPSEKKRYSKDHLILLIYIYYLKNVISIGDIQTMLAPLIEGYYKNPQANHSLQEIYESQYKLEQRQHFQVEDSIVKTLELCEKDFSGNEDSYIKTFTFLSLLGYDIYQKKKLMEKIIDEMSAEMKEKQEEQEKQKEAEKEAKKESRKKDKKKPEE